MPYRIYIGNLPIDIKDKEVEDLFEKYGKIIDVNVKIPARPPAYAFLTYEDRRDAEDAVKYRDGYDFAGSRLRVEFAKDNRDGDRGGRDRDRDRDNYRDRDSYRDRDDHRDRDRGGRRGPARRTEFGVIVSKLPRSCSWQDLKDYMRKAGDVIYADITGRNEGIVEYASSMGMENAIKDLDDTEFKNNYDSSYISVRYSRRSSSRSRGRKYSRSRSPRSRSPRSRSVSKSRSRSPVTKSDRDSTVDADK
eukprot:gene21623-27986_t